MRVVNGIFKLDVDEPITELCVECAPPPKPGDPPAQTQAHKLHRCTACNRRWIFGQFTDTFHNATDLERWLNEMNREWLLEKSL